MIPILIFTLIGISAAQVCPPPEVLHPCTCTITGSHRNQTELICSGIQENFNLKEVLDNASAFVNEDVGFFDRLAIINTSISVIEEGVAQDLTFRRFTIEDNSKLNYISPRAFNASWNTTTFLWLGNNQIDDAVDFFNFVNSFKNLETFGLHHSRISSIPDYAFQNMKLLKSIELFENNITSIGSKVFSDISRLRWLLMPENSISTEGLREDTFEGIKGNPAVLLICNKIDYMEQKRFQPLLDQGAFVFVGYADDTPSCPESEYLRLYCDERANWICDNEGRYRNQLFGFFCKDGTGYGDIWEYCRGTKEMKG